MDVNANEAGMRSKIMRWFLALFFLSVSLRSFFYLGHKFYRVHSVELFDVMVMVPLGLFALGLSYMYFKKIFQREPKQP